MLKIELFIKITKAFFDPPPAGIHPDHSLGLLFRSHRLIGEEDQRVVSAGGVNHPQESLDARNLDLGKTKPDLRLFLVNGNGHGEGIRNRLQEVLQKDFFFFLTTRLLKGLGPDVSGGVDPDGKPNLQFQKGLNQNPAVEAPIEKPNPPAIKEIGKLSDEIDDGSVHAHKRAGGMRKDKRQEGKPLCGAEPGGGFQPPVTLHSPLLSAVPDI